MTTIESGATWPGRPGVLLKHALLALVLTYLLLAGLWRLARPPRAAAQAAAPWRTTPVEVRNNDGALQPAIIIALHNGCQTPTAVAVTNVASYPVALDLVAGDCLYALAPQRFVTTSKEFHAYPAFAPFGATGNIAYVIANASWTIQPTGGILSHTVSSPGVPILLNTHSQSPLVLFNLLAALEWDANEPADLDIFSQALAAFSANLFDASNGQMIAGRLQLVTGGELWPDADFQIMAGNDVWPNADVGGIVPNLVQLSPEIAFRPGHLRVGRAWDGNSANQGPWNQLAGARTLLHEFGHYGLGLYDEYLGLAPDGADFSSFCTIAPNDPAYAADWASLMSYQYKANEFALRRNGNPMQWSQRCFQTIQFQLYNLSDWETLALNFRDPQAPPRWQIQLPTGGANPGPEAPLPGLTALHVTPAPVAPPTRTLFIAGAPPSVGDLQVYQFASSNRTIGPRLVSQGTTAAGKFMRLLGVYGGDELLVLDPEGVVATRIVVSASAELTLTLTQPGWSPPVKLTPAGDGQITISVQGLVGLTGAGAEVYERGSANPPFVLSLGSSGSISTALFTAPTPDFAGFLTLHADGARETVIPFALSAGAPSVHDTAHSPRADAHLARTGPAAQQPAVLWDARGQPSPPPGQRLVAARIAFDVAPVVAGEAPIELAEPLALWLSVREDDLPGGRASCLTLNEWRGSGQNWAPVGLVNELPVHFVSLPVTRTGSFALLRPTTPCLFKRVEAPDPVVGAIVTYSLGFDNAEDTWLPYVLITDPLSSALEPLTIQSNQPGQAGFNGQVAFWMGPLPPNSLLSITITAMIRPQTQPGQLVTNVAYGQASELNFVSLPVRFRACARVDINCDGVVDISDIIAAAEAWNAALVAGGAHARYDLDRDGRVTLLDLQIIAAGWGWHW